MSALTNDRITAASDDPNVNTDPPRSRRHRLAAALVSLALSVLAVVGVASPAGATVTFTSGDWATAQASYSCSSHQVNVLPTGSGALNGDYRTYVYASVYDYRLGWVSTPWYRVDGITTLLFFNITQPYAQAYVTYARVVNGAWQYRSEYVTIKNDLDNSVAFCKAGW